MSLPPIDRIPDLRSVSAELAAMASVRTIPVAPVNPTANAVVSVEPSPSVVNLVGQVHKPERGEGVYTSVSDPARRGSEAATAERDWTIQRPMPEKVEDPPPVPLSQLLLDHIKALWVASASAVQVQQQVKDQLDIAPVTPSAGSGALANEGLTYSPSKIQKTENL